MLDYLGTLAFLVSVAGVFYVCVSNADGQSNAEKYRAEVDRKLDMYLIE